MRRAKAGTGKPNTRNSSLDLTTQPIRTALSGTSPGRPRRSLSCESRHERVTHSGAKTRIPQG